MAISTRVKRVTDPLDDEVKACICGKFHHHRHQAGNEEEVEENDSLCLSELIHNFLEDNNTEEHEQSMDSDFSNSDSETNDHLSRRELTEVIKDLMNQTSDSFQLVLHCHVSKAIEIYSCLRSNKSILIRKVMIYLRELGFNSGICKTKWEKSGGLTKGNYEFIDVIRFQSRYIIDVDFTGEFEIARPTNQYERLVMALPRVYVGKSEELKQIVRLMCEAAKRSIKSRELHLPPWRKNRYMQSKWFGPYKRSTTTTVNQISSSSSSLMVGFDQKFAVKCRSLGFNAVNDSNCHFVIPAATRTR